ncbi:MAG: phage head-tail connector protein [Dyadobacter sp.]|uniref:head-tail connector protein n=1 Tax=Dyadobacter sp. TaxID=1914288 RepID=UPI001B152F17|nr:phage head-tail connector protein [Dyadobacter sp.]MBO9611050.1 phage head-tail connector protein [Dyadobacter sp.]
MVTRGFTYSRIETGEEPVDLAMYKAHLEIDFSDHDTLLQFLLKAARKQVEKFLSVSLVTSTITARWEELTSVEIPYGPVISVTSVKDAAGEDATHTIEGMVPGFARIKAGRAMPTILMYEAGMAEVDEDIQLAIMKLATDNFEQRTGLDLSGRGGYQLFANNWMKTVASHKRITWAA